MHKTTKTPAAGNTQRHVYGGAYITPAVWSTWEIRRYLLETETPGRFGYFTALEAAA